MEHREREEVRQLARATADLVDLVGRLFDKVQSTEAYSHANPQWAEWEQIRANIKSRVDPLTK